MNNKESLVNVKVTKDREPEFPNELSLKKNERIQVFSTDPLDSGHEDWWVGLKIGTDKVPKLGIFPSNCVEKEILNENLDQNIEILDNEYLVPEIKTLILDHREITIENLVGSGSYGIVFRGKFKDKVVALKIFNTKIEFIQKEVLNLFKVKSKHFIKFFGVSNLIETGNSDDGCKFPKFPQFNTSIVMEFAHGGPLNKILIQKPKLTPKILLDWSTQICDGMCYLHNRAKLFHRDLKTSNILIKESIKEPFDEINLSNKTILISDLGMACNADILTEDQSKLGTIAYAAPEVLKESKFLFQSDVWSFGVILWEILTMETPFRGIEQPHLFFLLTLKNFELFIPQSLDDDRCEPFITEDDVGTPKILRNTLVSCWLKIPEERPSFCEILQTLEQAGDQQFMNLTSEEFFDIQSNWRNQIYRHKMSLLENLSNNSSLQDEEVQLIQEISRLKEERKILQDALEKKDAEFKRKEEEFGKTIQKMRQNMFKFAVNTANQMVSGTCNNPVNVQPSLKPFRPLRTTLNNLLKSKNLPSSTNVGDTSDELSPNNFNQSFSTLTTNSKTKLCSSLSSSGTPTKTEEDSSVSFKLDQRKISGFSQNKFSTFDQLDRVGCNKTSQHNKNLAISPPSNLLHLVHVGIDKNSGLFQEEDSGKRNKIGKKSATLERSNNLNEIGHTLKISPNPPSHDSFDGLKNIEISDDLSQEHADDSDEIFKSTPSLLPLNVQIRPNVPFNQANYFTLKCEKNSQLVNSSRPSQNNLSNQGSSPLVPIPTASSRGKKHLYFSGRSRSDEDCRNSRGRIVDQINNFDLDKLSLHPSKALGSQLPVEVLINASPPSRSEFYTKFSESHRSFKAKSHKNAKKKHAWNYAPMRNMKNTSPVPTKSKQSQEQQKSKISAIETALWSIFQFVGISTLLVGKNQQTSKLNPTNYGLPTSQKTHTTDEIPVKYDKNCNLSPSNMKPINQFDQSPNCSLKSIENLNKFPSYDPSSLDDLTLYGERNQGNAREEEIFYIDDNDSGNPVSSSRDAYLLKFIRNARKLATKDGYLRESTPPDFECKQLQHSNSMKNLPSSMERLPTSMLHIIKKRPNNLSYDTMSQFFTEPSASSLLITETSDSKSDADWIQIKKNSQKNRYWKP